MNAKINKAVDEVERTRAKIAELQALLPELERKRIDMENIEIIRLVRSANITLADFPEFVKELNAPVITEPEILEQTADSELDEAQTGADGEAGDSESEENISEEDYVNI